MIGQKKMVGKCEPDLIVSESQTCNFYFFFLTGSHPKSIITLTKYTKCEPDLIVSETQALVNLIRNILTFG